MGQDKALLPWQGRTLLEHVAGEVLLAAGSVSVVGALEKYAVLGLPVIADREAGLGPLGGIRTALEAGLADWNLIVACDMPYVDSRLFQFLLAEAERTGADCLMPVGQPLCAVYHLRCLPVLGDALGQGIRKVRQALEGLVVEQVQMDQVLCFQNMNTPADWMAAKPVSTL